MINLGELCSDPEMGAEQLVCARQTQTMVLGRAVNAEAKTGFVGVVTMDKGSILERIADGQYVAGSILVTTVFPLRMAGPGMDADVVVRKGARFIVKALGDYLAHGFNWAVCEPLGTGA
jgi:galactose-6-phosphate isomerase